MRKLLFILPLLIVVAVLVWPKTEALVSLAVSSQPSIPDSQPSVEEPSIALDITSFIKERQKSVEQIKREKLDQKKTSRRDPRIDSIFTRVLGIRSASFNFSDIELNKMSNVINDSFDQLSKIDQKVHIRLDELSKGRTPVKGNLFRDYKEGEYPFIKTINGKIYQYIFRKGEDKELDDIIFERKVFSELLFEAMMRSIIGT